MSWLFCIPTMNLIVFIGVVLTLGNATPAFANNPASNKIRKVSAGLEHCSFTAKKSAPFNR